MRIVDQIFAWLLRRATNRALARIRAQHGIAVYEESLAALEHGEKLATLPPSWKGEERRRAASPRRWAAAMGEAAPSRQST